MRGPGEELTDILIITAAIVAFLLLVTVTSYVYETKSLSEDGTVLTFPDKPINRSP